MIAIRGRRSIVTVVIVRPDGRVRRCRREQMCYNNIIKERLLRASRLSIFAVGRSTGYSTSYFIISFSWICLNELYVKREMSK